MYKLVALFQQIKFGQINELSAENKFNGAYDIFFWSYCITSYFLEKSLKLQTQNFGEKKIHNKKFGKVKKF